MKNLVLLTASLVLVASSLLTGCCSYVNVDKDIPAGARVEGEKPIASFYVQNTSYQILGFIPWCSGVNWTEDDIALEDANYWRINFFCDNVSLDNNILTLKRACKEIGSNRIASMSHIINEDNIWSFLIVNRKTLKTSCFILEKKASANKTPVR